MPNTHFVQEIAIDAQIADIIQTYSGHKLIVQNSDNKLVVGST